MGYIVGLDVGTHTVKASIFEGSLGRYTFTRNSHVAVPAGDLPLQERQNEAIKELLQTFPRDTRCFLAYPAEGLSLKKLALPFDDQTKVEQTLPFYIEDQIPFEIDDVVIANRIINIEAGKTDIFLCVAPKDRLRAFLTRCDVFNIDSEILPVDADVLSNATSSPYEVVIDFGHQRTLCILCLAGKALLVRSMARGMNNIHTSIKEISHKTNIEDLLSKTQLMSPHVFVEAEESTQSVDACLIQELQKWSTAVRQILISFEDSLDIEISNIQLCGGGSQLNDITEYLTEDFGVPTSLMTITETHNPAGIYGLSYSIGLCAIGRTHGQELNLRTGEFSYKGNLERLGTLLKGFVIASIVLLCLGFSWFGFQYYQLQEELSQKNSDLVLLFTEIMPDYPVPDDPSLISSLITTEIEDTTEQRNALQRIFPREPPILSKLKAFSENIPPHSTARIDVSDMKFSKNSINIKAETDQFEQATSIVQELKKYPLFAQAQKSDEKNIANGVRFNIVIPLIQETKEEE